jgi:hypothetical protein
MCHYSNINHGVKTAINLVYKSEVLLIAVNPILARVAVPPLPSPPPELVIYEAQISLTLPVDPD